MVDQNHTSQVDKIIAGSNGKSQVDQNISSMVDQIHKSRGGKKY